MFRIWAQFNTFAVALKISRYWKNNNICRLQIQKYSTFSLIVFKVYLVLQKSKYKCIEPGIDLC